MRARMAAELTTVEAQIIDLDAERAKREPQDQRAIRAEAKTLDPDRILAAMTERRATFSRSDLNRALTEFLPDPKTRGAFTDKVLSARCYPPPRERKRAREPLHDAGGHRRRKAHDRRRRPFGEPHNTRFQPGRPCRRARPSPEP